LKAGNISSAICRFCKEKAIPYNNLITMSVSGWPDTMIVKNGITYYFEIKYGKDRLSALQEYRIKQLNKDRKIAFIVKSFPEFKKIYYTL